MKRVAVEQARVVQRHAVVVDGQCAEDDLVEAVTVDVGDGELVVALPLVFRAGFVGVEGPALDELAVHEIPRDDHRACVVAAAHHQRRVLAVEVGDAAEEAVDAVAVGVAPRADVPAARKVVDGVDRGAGLPVEDREELRAGEDVAAAVAVVRVGVADHRAFAVDRSVGRLHGDFRSSVAVVVEDLELRVVRASADVAPEVDAPQARAVELDRLDIDVAGVSRSRVVLRVRRVPQEDQLVLAVSVDVAHGAVARRVRGSAAVGHGLVGRLVERDVEVVRCPDAELVGDRDLAVVDLGCDEVGRVGCALDIDEVRRVGEGRIRDLRAVAVDVEAHRAIVEAEQAPAEVDAVVGGHGDGGAVEVLDVAHECRGDLGREHLRLLRGATGVQCDDLVEVWPGGQHVVVGVGGLRDLTDLFEGDVVARRAEHLVKRDVVGGIPRERDMVAVDGFGRQPGWCGGRCDGLVDHRHGEALAGARDALALDRGDGVVVGLTELDVGVDECRRFRGLGRGADRADLVQVAAGCRAIEGVAGGALDGLPTEGDIQLVGVDRRGEGRGSGERSLHGDAVDARIAGGGDVQLSVGDLDRGEELLVHVTARGARTRECRALDIEAGAVAGDEVARPRRDFVGAVGNVDGEGRTVSDGEVARDQVVAAAVAERSRSRGEAVTRVRVVCRARVDRDPPLRSGGG